MPVYISPTGSGSVNNGLVTNMPRPGGQLENYWTIRTQSIPNISGSLSHIDKSYKSGALTGWERPGSSFA